VEGDEEGARAAEGGEHSRIGGGGGGYVEIGREDDSIWEVRVGIGYVDAGKAKATMGGDSLPFK